MVNPWELSPRSFIENDHSMVSSVHSHQPWIEAFHSGCIKASFDLTRPGFWFIGQPFSACSIICIYAFKRIGLIRPKFHGEISIVSWAWAPEMSTQPDIVILELRKLVGLFPLAPLAQLVRGSVNQPVFFILEVCFRSLHLNGKLCNLSRVAIRSFETVAIKLPTLAIVRM